MDIFLGKVTQHAMNYAIRSGVTVTASFAFRQATRLLKTVDNTADYQEIHDLQQRLDGKIRIISPAIDMIELISARGNTTLESAVSLTKALRWDIQALGVRLAKAANEEENSRRTSRSTKSHIAHEVEIRLIVKDIRNLLTKIEDAVPLINLAITTSGASLSTSLPATVSPSRLLQASTFLTAGDTQFSMNPDVPIQVGPTFTLSIYMLFSSYVYVPDEKVLPDSIRDIKWKEAIHKARVKLIRTPLHMASNQSNEASIQEDNSQTPSMENMPRDEFFMSGRGKASEFAYHIEIVEDLDDGRVHTFEEHEPQPGPYGDITLAGIRELLPIYQISKIFYADTGKILDLGSQSETNNPVLLLKRDINALPPRRMMQENEQEYYPHADYEDGTSNGPEAPVHEEEGEEDPELELERQIRRESSAPGSDVKAETPQITPPDAGNFWRFPLNLDPEWLALEVYTETDDSSSEEEPDLNDDSAYASHRPSSSGQKTTETTLATEFSDLKINSSPSPRSPRSPQRQVASPAPMSLTSPTKMTPFSPIRSSLSLLEMLIRLTALQQFQQAFHLSIPDEFLTFFLEESSTTGAGGDGDQRRETRREARRKVGFDPYDESPIKRRGEDYQYQQKEQGQDGYNRYSRGGTPYDEYDQGSRYPSSPQYAREHNFSPPTSHRTPDSWPLDIERELMSRSRRGTPDLMPSSSMSSYRPNPNRKVNRNRPLERVHQDYSRTGKIGSPLGRGVSVETDSSLGTSPGSPTLVARKEDT